MADTQAPVLKRESSADKLLEKKVRRNSEQFEKLKLENSGEAPPTWWFIGAFVTFSHIVALYAIFFYSAPWQIYVSVVVVNYFTAFGITAGYHRLWSHRAYSASLPLRILLAYLGTNAYQGSIKWWVQRHRMHHRYTDTEYDPYNSQRGFYYSHMGWMFEKPHYPKLKTIDVSDLMADPVVRFQHKYIVPCLFFCGFVVPAAIGYYFGDTWGGILWVGYVGRLYVWHATWSINSFAHWMGDRLFCDNISARGNLICAFLTSGEGYHNFHHEFPRDYRNGVRWYDYDPTKWFIRLMYYLGFASNLHRASKNAMLQCRVQVSENRVAKTRARLAWGPQEKELPEWTFEEFETKCREDKSKEWIVIRGFVHDVSEFKDDHPGGAKLLVGMRGRDATAAFEGGMNKHSFAAKNLAAMYRVGKIIRRDEPKYVLETEGQKSPKAAAAPAGPTTTAAPASPTAEGLPRRRTTPRAE